MNGPPRPLELTRLAAEHLAGKGIEDARLDAELLLAHVLDLKRLDLYLQFERPLEPSEVDAYREVIRRRAAREPLQYITGTAAFRELELTVDPRVLIPRPETEVLVGAVLDWSRGQARELVALDLGTGSGAIALSLLVEGPFARVVATDTSAEALEVAAANAARTGVEDRLDLRKGPLFEPIGGDPEYDVIVTNPPYVAESDHATLMPEVVEHEPGEALFAGPDGLELIRRIVAAAPEHIAPGGLLAIEVGPEQAAAVAALVQDHGLMETRIVRDLAGRERVVLGASPDAPEGTP